jgi:ribosomal protein S18 acetylase RimI-like enzyme
MDYLVYDGTAAFAPAAEIFGVYDAVFHDGSELSTWLDSPWGRHLARDGFRLATAREARRLIGFAWGYTGGRGQHWSDLVADSLPRPVAETWVGGHFELVELAVLEGFRRHGVGGRLHDVLLDGLPHERALLSTSDDEQDPGVRLYRSRGWVSLGRLGGGVQVLGRRLRA